MRAITWTQGSVLGIKKGIRGAVESINTSKSWNVTLAGHRLTLWLLDGYSGTLSERAAVYLFSPHTRYLSNYIFSYIYMLKIGNCFKSVWYPTSTRLTRADAYLTGNHDPLTPRVIYVE